MRDLRGALHVHSSHSTDGEVDLAEVASLFRREGRHFVCLTEHAGDLDAGRMASLVRRCGDLSDGGFCLIPGLEFESREGLHVLGVGLSRFVPGRSVREIISAIHAQGGLAILAHPPRGAERLLAGLEDLPDGLELWNTKYDTRYAPRLHRFALLHRLRTLKRDVWGYCSVDFHWRSQCRTASLLVRAERVASAAVLDALRAGRFTCAVGRATVQCRGDLSGLQTLSFGLRECGARMLVAALRGAKRAVRALRLPLPTRRLRAIAHRVT